MKKLLFFFAIILLIFSCRDNCYVRMIPKNDIALTVKAFYDSEWGGIKEQILDCIEIYECVTEPSCNIPYEYMDTVYYSFALGDIRHEKKVFYQWEIEENETSNFTKTKFNIYLFGEFFHPDFYYSYGIYHPEEFLTINIIDPLLENHYIVEFAISSKFNGYTDDEFFQSLISHPDFQIQINKSNLEIQPHSFTETMTTGYDNPCDPYLDIPQTYRIPFMVQ